MLSYRHSFHAGNPADVIKHLVLAQVLGYQTIKDKPLDYIDTHSGAGFFELAADDAQKTQEYLDGIAKLWQHHSEQAALNDYIALIKAFNTDEQLAFYPGSPKIAEHFLRRQDNGWFFELHPRDLALLNGNMQGKRSIRVRGENGFQGLLGLLPPASRRACVLIDPPYEIKDDYETVVNTLIKAYKRFATGTYMVWYPVVERARIDKMEADLIASGIRNIQLFELATQGDTDVHGMTASGMIVINPPWKLKQTMDAVLPELVALLSQASGFYRSEQLVDE
ncbi:23S rRNA (adenine(2030)-N(6))-methyltransferase RlmJ [Pseudoalteromonas mariniglutinosa]|uniref:23S rRNA (adenine(2030)-N(6))-methyltransferase RlmJ n=1 Tax=Pseudoalteromonas mariniglutinosa TaxID=206042 RepID=UPI00384B9919